jgi:hypothetical protein
MSIPEEDENLVNASRILIYYVRMYIESLDWIKENYLVESGWDFLRNAILEVNLLYSRILIEFVIKKPKYSSDKFASSYFYDSSAPPYPVNSPILEEYKNILDKQLAHITTGGPFGFKIKSQQGYQIYVIADELIPHLKNFFELVSEDRIDSKAKEDAFRILRISPDLYPDIGLNSST